MVYVKRVPSAKVYTINHPRYSFMVKLARPGGKPLKKYFKTAEAAEEEARRLNNQLTFEGQRGIAFDAEQRAEWLACRGKLDPLGVTIRSAVNWFLDHYVPPAGIAPKTALESLATDYRMRNARPTTIDSTEKRLAVFFKWSEVEDVSQVTPGMVREFLAGYAHPKTRAGHRSALSTLEKHLNRQGIKTSGWMDISPSPRLDPKQPIIATVAECKAFLAVAKTYGGGRWLRNVAVRMFAGLRPEEMEHLAEENIRGDVIRVTFSKIRGRRGVRVVPVLPCLARMLEATQGQRLQPAARAVLPFQKMKERAGLGHLIGTRWLRKSWISYRLAVTKDEKQVAREAGNSPDIIYRDYWSLTTEQEGNAFFDLS